MFKNLFKRKPRMRLWYASIYTTDEYGEETEDDNMHFASSQSTIQGVKEELAEHYFNRPLDEIEEEIYIHEITTIRNFNNDNEDNKLYKTYLMEL